MYEAIADAADTRAIAFEVGDGDAQRVANVLAGYGYATRITRDLAGRGRIVEGQRS
jgi:methylase of polypeptide subunit release factors